MRQDQPAAVVEGGVPRLIALFRDASPMTASHWNVVTGEIFAVKNSRRSRVAVETFEERLFDEEGWHEVPFQESDDAYQMMAAFADELRPGKGRTALLRAVESDKPFRAFRVVCNRYPSLQRRWRRSQDDEALARLVGFCLANELWLDDARFAAEVERVESQWRAADAAEGKLAAAALSIGRKR